MQLPKYVDRTKVQLKMKICHEPECGKEFLGHPIQKYCELHHDIRNRQKKKKRKFVDINNVKVEKISILDPVLVWYPCELEGCGKQFMVRIFPRMRVRPKYCEMHRCEYKRELFLRERKAAA